MAEPHDFPTIREFGTKFFLNIVHTNSIKFDHKAKLLEILLIWNLI